ncbi:MAG: GNAT family N-acetyltransferase [Rhodospirillaceae bacterium]|nr:GNAT family N-acetyltransferase [Rhodospirillaceae bacterium]
MTADVLHALIRNLQATAALGRETVPAGPFRAYFARDNSDYLLSVAVPVEASDDWPGAVAGLLRMFHERGRMVRLEYFAECFPALTPVLEVAGIRREATAAVMTLRASDLRVRRLREDVGVEILKPGDDQAVTNLLNVMARCFDLGNRDSLTGWRTILSLGLADGSIRAALARVDGEIVGGANLLVGGGSAELAGVGTLPGQRRRGLATGLCYRLLADYFAHGHRLAWLSTGQEIRTLYDRLGFQAVGTQLNYGLRRR